ncbi:SDR family oxidoreductase [Streptomyces sp. MP131-18]|uniref:SDR family oxidoreductase n=1 Tax=Streptomyces sp. MP131-18 TaxID=1857892 RepID=UPI00097BFB0F|nr:SDR family oxidoreductase [Streptomyces sp. MP131-18]
MGGSSSADTVLEVAGDAVPLGPRGDPDEIADAVFFRASPLSAYITGPNLYVDGGPPRSDGLRIDACPCQCAQSPSQRESAGPRQRTTRPSAGMLSLWATAPAMATRCRMPQDSCHGQESGTSASPTAPSTARSPQRLPERLGVRCFGAGAVDMGA